MGKNRSNNSDSCYTGTIFGSNLDMWITYWMLQRD